MEIGELGQILELAVSPVEEGLNPAIDFVTVHLLLLEDLTLKELDLSHNHATLHPAQASNLSLYTNIYFWVYRSCGLTDMVAACYSDYWKYLRGVIWSSNPGQLLFLDENKLSPCKRSE